MILCQSDMLVPPISSTFLNILIRNIGKPPKLASGEEEDIAQGWVVRMDIRDALKRLSMVAIQDNVLRAPWLITITQDKNCNLSDRGIRGLVVPPITTWIKAQCNATLLSQRHGTRQLKSLLVVLHPRMGVEEHVLQSPQSARIEAGVPCIGGAMHMSHIRITDVKL
jgi:hypothetical protein